MYFLQTSLIEPSAKKECVQNRMASGHGMRSLQQVRNNFYREMFSGLYKLYLLKLPAPPCAVLLVVSLGVCIKISLGA